MDHCQAVSYCSECEFSTVQNCHRLCNLFIRLLTGNWLLFRALRSVEALSIYICPIKPYPVKTSRKSEFYEKSMFPKIADSRGVTTGGGAQGFL